MQARTTAGRRIAITAIAATILAALLVPASAGARTICAMEADGRYCAADATDFPQAKGWYGWISQGNACGPSPIAGWFGTDSVGACGGGDEFYNEPVWRHQAGGWVASTLPKGSRTYVAPFTSEWRWVYTQTGGWAAIRARNLVLKWKA